jgi:hypothetical protein
MWKHARVQVFHGGGPRVKHQIERPIIGCCCYRESDRKSDLSRLVACVFGPLLPLVKLFSRSLQYQFSEGGPPWVQNSMLAGCPMRQLNRS